MKSPVLILAAAGLLCTAAQSYSVQPNTSGKWAIGWVDSDTCCSIVFDDCSELAVDEAPLHTPLDVYVVAAEVDAIDGSRFGLAAARPENIFFYGWVSKADSDDPSIGWPGSGEGIDLTWNTVQPGPFVTMGVLQIYTYGAARICLLPDPRVGFAEWRSGTSSAHRKVGGVFGCVGFGPGTLGYNPCGEVVALEQTSWGAIKALYRR